MRLNPEEPKMKKALVLADMDQAIADVRYRVNGSDEALQTSIEKWRRINERNQ